MAAIDRPKETEDVKERKRLDIAVVGLPNAGKSQLLNVLCKTTVSAVSRKRHTTRSGGILGAYTHEDTQLVFADTPGFMQKHDARHEALDSDLNFGAPGEEIAFCDFTLLVVDAARTLNYQETLAKLMLEALDSQGRLELMEADEEGETLKPTILDPQRFAIVLNKVDLVYPKSNLMDLAIELGNLAESSIEHVAQEQDEIIGNMSERLPMFFYVSSLKNDGIDELRDFLMSKATPSSEWAVEGSTNLEPLEQVEEIIREKIYRCLHKEVPYNIRQSNRIFRTGLSKGVPTLLVHQDLIVRTESHQKMLRGATLDRIRSTAERDISKMWKCQVKLHLHVKLPRSANRRWSI